MAGRTAKVNGRDAVDRAMAIYFEGEVALAWLDSLHKRAEQILRDWSDVLPEEEQDNLRRAHAALMGGTTIGESKAELYSIVAQHGATEPATVGAHGRGRRRRRS